MKILAIETSCDETGIALLGQEPGSADIALLSNALASQVAMHAQYGGVFPAMAKRAHAEKIVPLLKECLGEAGMLVEIVSGGTVGTAARETIVSICSHEDEMVSAFVDFFNTYQKPDIDYIAVTVGPGLEPALWVGINAAKVLSTVWNIPVIPINHMEGHIVTATIQEQEATSAKGHTSVPPYPPPGEDSARKHVPSLSSQNTKTYQFRKLEFPLLALLVSGAHTELVLTKSYRDYQKIGQTRDDAVGEAFDKVARMLGLPYPGGPAISKMAREFRTSGAEQPFVLPRPMLHSADYDFSFSGIKTATLYTIRDLTDGNTRELTVEQKLALACAFEDAVIEVIIKKTLRAAEEFHIQTIVVGGGVSGNTYLREQLTAYLATRSPNVTALFPEPWLATDNAVMIGLAAYARIRNETFKTQDALTLKANGGLSLQNTD